MAHFNFKLSDETREAIRKEAYEKEESMGDVVRRALDYYFIKCDTQAMEEAINEIRKNAPEK